MSSIHLTGSDSLGREFLITRQFNAPRELVFRAWTDPQQIAVWWGPKGFTNPVCEWEACPGGRIYVVMRAPDGTDFAMGGEIRELLPPEKLVLTTGALDEKGNLLFEFLHTLTLTERDGTTDLVLRSRVIRTTPGADRYIGGFEMGMTMSLERLDEHLAQGTAPLVVERIMNAPVNRVWQALTQAEQIRRWSFPVSDFQPVVGFEFEFSGGKDGRSYRHQCRVMDVIVEKRLTYSWRYAGHAGNSVVSVELFAEGERTRVRLTHAGLESFPNLPDFARENFVAGWNQLIGSLLRSHVEGELATNIPTGTADREIVISREFQAPRELVWEAMTNPEHVAKWWGPRGFSTTIEVMDFRVGGMWKHVMRGPDGTNYPNKSIFREIVKPERIVYTHGGGREQGPGASFTATWTFEELAPDRTRLTNRMVFGSAEERDFVVREFGAIEGGRQTLMRLSERLSEAQCPAFTIVRSFNATRDLVWKAWTEQGRLMEWFGPKGCTIPVARLDFRVDGQFHYCMRTPDGKEMWGLWIFREITAPERILLANSFSDAAGNPARPPFPGAWSLQMLTETTFTEQEGKTTVTLKWFPLDATEEERQNFNAMRPSFNQGWKGTFDQLEEYLAKA